MSDIRRRDEEDLLSHVGEGLALLSSHEAPTGTNLSSPELF